MRKPNKYSPKAIAGEISRCVRLYHLDRLPTAIAEYIIDNFVPKLLADRHDAELDRMDVIRVVCQYFGTTLQALKRRTRKTQIRYRRQVLIYFLATRTDMTLDQIAHIFRLANHTSAIAARDKIIDRWDGDQTVRQDVTKIITLLPEPEAKQVG